MINSRDVELLRPDVAANCKVWMELCRDQDLEVLVTGTVRDEEYQRYCYQNGTAATPYPSFHSEKAGLAFDFCQNIKGKEYSDLEFFRRAGEIGEKIGFEWGGRWTSFPDRPHLQWSDGGKYTSSMIRAGKYPPNMPLYKEVEEVTQEQFNAMMEVYLVQQREKESNTWSSAAWDKATTAGVFDGTAPQAPLSREQASLVLDRLGLLGKE